MALFVCTWLWGDKWKPVYAERLFAGVKRNLKQDFRSVLITDRPVHHGGADLVVAINDDDRVYIERPGCLVRMRMFDAAWQEKIGAVNGDRIVNIDVDAVITGALDPLFDRDGEFTIMQGYNTTNPCPFNGSLWMFRAGERHDVWDDFSLDAHARFGVPVHHIVDDQGWLHHKFQKAAAYTPDDGVYAFRKKNWPGGKGLPEGARIIAFPGRDPNDHADRGWIKEHWGERC